MLLELSKNIEHPQGTSGGDYLLLKKGEVKVGFVITIDEQSKTVHIQSKFYRNDGTWIQSVGISDVSINEESVFVNNESILEKKAFENYQVYPVMSQKTLDLLLSSELNKIALSNYVVAPAK